MDGRNSVWPHDPRTGWNYCFTIPSWILVPKSGASDSVAFYRVQVGVQSPEGITTTRVVLRRFSDFLNLNLLSELKKAFPHKTLPPAPPKKILRMKSRNFVEEVKDLEVDLETTRNNCKENTQQAVLIERERFTQTQWDVEELRRQCLDLELKLKYEQDEKAHVESAKTSILHDNIRLLQQLDVARKELGDLHKDHEELQVKSKTDVKLLVKEVKSLQNSQIELKQELSRLMKEKLELERAVHKEKQRTENVTAANAKLLHECEILHNRLEECSVNFLIKEEDKLIVDTSSPSDAIDLLTTSDNQIGLHAEEDWNYLLKLGAGSFAGAAVIKYGSILFPEITRPNILQALIMISTPVVVAIVLLIKQSRQE